MKPKSIPMKMFTARLEDKHLEFLDRAGPRKRSWRLRRDLDILKRLLVIAQKMPDTPIAKAVDLALDKRTMTG